MKRNKLFGSWSRQLLMPAFLLFAGCLLSVEMKAQDNSLGTSSSEDVLQLPLCVLASESDGFSAFVVEDTGEVLTSLQINLSFEVVESRGVVNSQIENITFPSVFNSQWNNPLNTLTNSTPLII